MKTLRESLLDDDLSDSFDKNIKAEIKKFLKLNYKGYSNCKISRDPNQDGKYEVSSTSDIVVINRNITSLTNGMFIWTLINGSFYCSGCKSLKSLEGAPKEISKVFDCSHCDSLISLEGAPGKVGGTFYCSNCQSLKSLKGAPEKVGGTFDCSYCQSLKTLEGAPKEVGRNFSCDKCKVKFTEDDVKKISDVKGEIIN